MGAATKTAVKLGMEKTDVPCLYRYAANGVYYALVKHHGKQVVRSLETTEKLVAKRKLGDFKAQLGKVDPSLGSMTLRRLAERYLQTVQNNKTRTLRRKIDIVKRLISDIQVGADTPVSKLKRSHLEAWLAGYDFGYASHNLYLECFWVLMEKALRSLKPWWSQAIAPGKIAGLSLPSETVKPKFAEFATLHPLAQRR